VLPDGSGDSAALRPLLDLQLTVEDCGNDEEGHIHSTLAHPIERLYFSTLARRLASIGLKPWHQGSIPADAWVQVPTIG
jgi:hypothetical protein